VILPERARIRTVGPTIAGEELAELLKTGRAPTLLDVRWELSTGPDREAYLRGHIPGAVFIDLDRDLAAEPGPGGRHPLPEAEAFGTAMRAAGVSAARPVVVYDAANGSAAARAWWLLRYFEHHDVAVLDGGLEAWTAAGGPLERESPTPAPGDFVPQPGGMPLLDAACAARLAATGVLLDARAPERYRGEREPIDSVAGHIPGARNRPATSNVDARGRFLHPRGLRAAFEQLGVGDGVEVGAYCGSGVSAAHEVLALELAGFPAALYAGSWSEWITDPGHPVATGPG
jgi:thiosulfate/3-mercaptopyruvate sulfurtransferase